MTENLHPYTSKAPLYESRWVCVKLRIRQLLGKKTNDTVTFISIAKEFGCKRLVARLFLLERKMDIIASMFCGFWRWRSKI
jgi:hypothetical protein